MHAAPPVRIACNVGAGWRRAVTLVAAASAAVFVSWAARWLGAAALPAAGLGIAAALAAAAIAWRAGAPRPCELGWDGSRWRLVGEAASATDGVVDVMLDLGDWLLLRWRAAPLGSTCWLTARRFDAREDYASWRAALYGPVPRA